jgi:hypothetical protein
LRAAFRRGNLLRLSALFLLVGLVWGCSPHASRVAYDSMQNLTSLKVVVLPFRQIFPEDLEKGAVESPLSGAIFDAARPVGLPEALLEADFLRSLDNMGSGVSVVSGDEASQVFRRIASSSLKTSLRDALGQTGRELGADTVVVGYLYRFRELQGESFSAGKPASVAFEIVMLKADDGRIVWRGIFDRTQKSLMENIFQANAFFKGHGKWLSAEKLLSQGLDEVMQTFPLVTPR